eukprot:6606477-Prorocentrum_lima.AAC.1
MVHFALSRPMIRCRVCKITEREQDALRVFALWRAAAASSLASGGSQGRWRIARNHGFRNKPYT